MDRCKRSRDFGRRSALAQALALLSAGLLAGCGRAVLPVAAHAVPAPLPPLDLDPIEKLAAAAQLAWLITVEPQRLLQHRALAPGLSRLLTSERVAALEQITAINASRLRRVVIASYPRSTLYVLDGVEAPQLAVERFSERMLTGVTTKSYRPDVVWLQGHGYDAGRRSIASLGERVVAIEAGGALHTRVAALFALGRVRRAPRALELPDLALLAERLGPAPLFALASGPFEGDWARGVHGVLSRCTAVGGCVQPDDAGVLAASVLFVGDWQADAQRALERVIASWEDLQHSSLGRLTGLDELVAPLTTTQEQQVVGVHVRVSGPKLLDGMYTAVRAELREMFDIKGAQPRG